MITFPSSESPEVTIIVVGWKDSRLLMPCLNSIVKSITDIDYEVRIVLNEPSAALASAVAGQVRGAHVDRFGANLGFGGAVNFAAAGSAAPYLAFLNDDCIVEGGWLEALVDLLSRRPACAIAGSRFLHPDGVLQEAGSVLWSGGSTAAFCDEYGCVDVDFEREVDYCSAGSVLVRRQAWEQAQGFDDCYYPAYWEDVDLALRLKRLGWQIWYQPRSEVRHTRSASTNVTYREFIVDRARQTFIERWQSELAERPVHGEFETAMWAAMGRPVRVLVIDDTVPISSSGSGFGRMFDTLSALTEDPAFHVALHPRLAAGADAAAGLPRLRVITDLERHLATPGVSYEVVVVSRPHNVEIYRALLDEYLPDTCQIYDAEALYHRRLELQADLVTDSNLKESLLQQASDMRRVEERAFADADAVVVISEQEATIVRAHTRGSVHVVEPWLVEAAVTDDPFSSRFDIGLVAGWAAGPGSPNCDGLLWFAREVLPLIRARAPSCRLLVTGDNPPEDVRWLSGPSVEFVGLVPDLSGFYGRIRVAISPTRYGAGVKLKTVEAIQHGVPVVATVEAAHGLTRELADAVWVAEDPVRFADAVFALISEESSWHRQRALAICALQSAHLGLNGTGSWPSIVNSVIAQRRERIV